MASNLFETTFDIAGWREGTIFKCELTYNRKEKMLRLVTRCDPHELTHSFYSLADMCSLELHTEDNECVLIHLHLDKDGKDEHETVHFPEGMGTKDKKQMQKMLEWVSDAFMGE
jgi:hypothetical protein